MGVEGLSHRRSSGMLPAPSDRRATMGPNREESMKKYPLALAALAAMALAACGPEEHPPIPRVEIDPESHFAVELCNCFEYEASDDKSQRLAVSVEAVTDHYTRGEVGQLVRYRQNGLIVREDMWFPAKDALRLGWTRITSETPELTGWFKPSIPLVAADKGDTLQLSTTFEISGDAQPVEFVANVIQDRSIRYSVDGSAPQAQPATQLHYQGMPWDEGDRYFVADTGFVEIAMKDGSGTRQRYQLRNKRVLGGGCGETEGLKPPTDICGSR